jgi:hypothetical protein
MFCNESRTGTDMQRVKLTFGGFLVLFDRFLQTEIVSHVCNQSLQENFRIKNRILVPG